MNRLALLLLALAACGDDISAPPPIVYTDPSGGALRLIKNAATRGDQVVLDLVVGDKPVTGYSAGFDLPLDPAKVTLVGMAPGTALSPGSAPSTALASIPKRGPLAGELVTAQSQKATGEGAVTTDTTLAPGTVLYTIELDRIPNAPIGVVFDGTAKDFVLPSGGLRDRAGNTVVAAKDVAIGKLEVTQQ